jgi:hypothetical protein
MSTIEGGKQKNKAGGGINTKSIKDKISKKQN